MKKDALLKDRVEHLCLDSFDPVPLVEAMDKMAFQARSATLLAIYEKAFAYGVERYVHRCALITSAIPLG